MKFTIVQITAAILSASAASAAYLEPRHDTSTASSSVNSTGSSSYPQDTNVNILNGTWYLTGITQNAWNYYNTFSKAMNLEINCLQLNVTGTSNTSFDALASAFLGRQGQDVGVNASAAGVFSLRQPDSGINVTNKEFAWDAYGSQVFVNKDSWENFTSGGQKQEVNPNSGSAVIPGTKPFQASLYSKLIDSKAAPGDNATNIDTVFFWGKQIKFFSPDQYSKRGEQTQNIYGVILSKTPNVEDDVFNKTLTLLPQQVIENNVSIVKLNDTCNK